jgi:hypothetical protein
VRLIIAAAGGWLAVAGFGGDLTILFYIVVVATIAFGGIPAAAFLIQGVGQRARQAPKPA